MYPIKTDKIYIYVIYNFINGKTYVGQTITPKQRWVAHRNSGDNLHLGRAIKKYGRENFLLQILTCVKTIEEADACEIYWISYFDSTNKDLGYNIDLGGQANRIFSLETRQKMSIAKKGKKLSKEHVQKVVLAITVYGEKEKLQFCEDYKLGLTIKNIALKYNCSPMTVSRALDKFSIERRTPQRIKIPEVIIEPSNFSKNSGEKSGRAKLTESLVLHIRKWYAESNVSAAEIAEYYSIHRSTITTIINRKIWKHI